MASLTPKEIDALLHAIEGKPLNEKRGKFDHALKKLRWGTYIGNMVEEQYGCDYSLKWFRSNKKEARELIERYQFASKSAESLFWKIRQGIEATQLELIG